MLRLFCAFSLQLKPYVSYKVVNVTQSEFTAKDLFNACYAKKVLKDMEEGKIDADDIEQKKDQYLKNTT